MLFALSLTLDIISNPNLLAESLEIEYAKTYPKKGTAQRADCPIPQETPVMINNLELPFTRKLIRWGHK